MKWFQTGLQVVPNLLRIPLSRKICMSKERLQTEGMQVNLTLDKIFSANFVTRELFIFSHFFSFVSVCYFKLLLINLHFRFLC